VSIPKSHIKERLSIAYVQAVTAIAGVKFFGDNVTEYGIDGYFQQIRRLPDGLYKEVGMYIQCQVKATTTSVIRKNKVVYDMRVKAYNKLVDVVDDDPPTILILFRIPSDEEINTWLSLNDEQLVLRYCCYWDYIVGSRSENKRSHRIEIPVEQKLTPQAINDFFRMLKEGKF